MSWKIESGRRVDDKVYPPDGPSSSLISTGHATRMDAFRNIREQVARMSLGDDRIMVVERAPLEIVITSYHTSPSGIVKHESFFRTARD